MSSVLLFLNTLDVLVLVKTSLGLLHLCGTIARSLNMGGNVRFLLGRSVDLVEGD